jgi:hypothetical protein
MDFACLHNHDTAIRWMPDCIVGDTRAGQLEVRTGGNRSGDKKSALDYFFDHHRRDDRFPFSPEQTIFFLSGST